MYNISDIRKKLLIKYPPYGSFLANLPFIEDYTCTDNGLPTAETDDNAIYYHPDYLNKLTEKQQIAVFAHEISHVVLKHLERSKGKNFDIWNIACDASINENLKLDGLELTPGMIKREDALLYSEEELYEIILEENRHNKKQNNQKPHVLHDSWKKSNKNQENENSETEEDDLSNNKKEEMSQVINANDFFKKARRERIENLKKIKESLLEQSLKPDSNQRLRNHEVKELGEATRIVDWRRLLEDTCHIDKDWTYQNATIEYGVLTPHMEDLPAPLVEIMLDTSDSVNKNLLRNFLKECLGILQFSKIKVGCFDINFYGFHEIRNKKDIENFPIEGGGGTAFNAAVRAFTKDADNKIIFTDGKSNMPNISMNIIWVVFGNQKINPLGGKVIYIDDKELHKLNITTSSTRRR